MAPTGETQPKKKRKGFVPLSISNPALAAQLVDQSLASELSASSAKKPLWRCTIDPEHTWNAAVGDRSKGGGCPRCYGRTGLTLLEINPALAAQLVDQSLASKLSAGSVSKPLWRCTINPDHTWNAAVGGRSKGSGCPECYRLPKVPLSASNPSLAAQLVDQSLASQISDSSAARPRWRCTTNPAHTWEAAVFNRSKGSGCPECYRLTIIPLSVSNPALAAQLVDQSLASQISAGSERKPLWSCTSNQGHTWKATVNARSHGGGCPRCAKSGIDLTAPTHLYLIEHPGHGLVKVGIANATSPRVATFAGRGWELLRIQYFAFGADARSEETAIHGALRAVGATISKGQADVVRSSLGGETEMFNASCDAVALIDAAFDRLLAQQLGLAA